MDLPDDAIESFRKRAEIVRSIRRFFDERGYLAAETPLLAATPIPEAHLELFRTELLEPDSSAGTMPRREYFLLPSPEYYLKQLLAAGVGNLYEITRSFRNAESRGDLHNPEFTMLEYYTVDADSDRSLVLTMELLRVTQVALEQGIAAVRRGNRVNDISRAVFRVIKEHDYGVVRPYCGHGVGLAIHEDPQIPNYVGRGPNPRLKTGMVIAVEPMVNAGIDDIDVLDDEWTVVTADRKLSAHYEHTVAIFADHTEVLTRRRSELLHSNAEVSA